MKLKIHLTVFLLLTSFLISAQEKSVRTNAIDSLQSLLQKTGEDTTRIHLMLMISQNYRQIDKDKSMSYALQGLELSKKINYRKGYYSSLNNEGLTYYNFGERKKALDLFLSALTEATAENELPSQAFLSAGAANCYYQMGDKENALKYRLISMHLAEQMNDRHALSSDYMDLGLIYEETGDYKKELECYRKALALQEEFHDEPNMANTLENLGIFFIYRQDSLNAFKNLLQALAIRQKLGDKNAEAVTTNNIAGAYTMFGDPQTGLVFLMKALKIHESTGDIAGIASATGNISEIYGEMKNYPKAIEFIKRSMEAHVRSNDSSGIAVNYKNLANTYTLMGKLNDAENAARISFALTKKFGSKNMILDGYLQLSDILFQKGDTRNAYLLHKQYSVLKDSLMTIESSKQINEMNVKYESEKKDKEILVKDNELKLKEADALQKSYQRNAFIGGFIILLVLAFIIFRSYRLKKNANILISKQKNLVEEKQKEIIDSINYAKRIQQSLMPTEKYIDRSLNRLKKP